MLQRLLLLPLLTPLLAVLLVGAINPRPWVALRLLTWTSAAWPMGAWIGAAAAAGAGLSAAGTALALQAGSAAATPPRRRVRSRGDADPEPWSEAAAPEPPSPRRNPDPTPAWAGPSRAPGDPAPTVSVPFRVIRRGSKASPAQPSPATTPSVSVGDGWDTASNDDW